jgi:hypothetical protein
MRKRHVSSSILRRTALGLALALPCAPLAAQVQHVGPSRLLADPGAPLTIAFRVRNPLATTAPAIATLPPGWPAVAPESAARMEPGASAIVLLATVVPRGAAAASYVLRYRLGASADSVVIVVRERREVEVAVEQAPRFVVAGTEYAAGFRVTNRGNAPASIRLAAESTLGFAARLDASILNLAPGEGRVVHVTVATHAAARVAAHRLTLRASGQDAAASASARVPLVARGARGARGGVASRTLPATVTLRASRSGQERGGVPGTLSASGALTAGTRVDLFYRGRGAAAPEWGEQEQLSVALRGPRGELRVGDQYWALSPLTAPGRAGFGAGARLNAGPLWAEGFSARRRYLPDAPRVTGAALGIGGEAGAVSANYLSAGTGAAPALSLRGRASPVRGLGADLEYGAAGGARAGYARLSGGRAGFGFDLRGLHADPSFPGDQAGRTLLQVDGGARLPLGLRVQAAYARERRVDTLGLVLAGTELETSAVHARATLRELLAVERRARTREGVAAAGPFSRRADSWTAWSTWHRRGATLGGGAELGKTEDRVTGISSRFSRTWLRGGASAGIGSLWAGVERRTGTSLETGVAEQRLSGAGSLELVPAVGTRLSLTAQAGDIERVEGRDAIVDGTIEQRLPRGHALRLRLRAFPWVQSGARKPLVYLDYAIPLRVPMGRDRSTGAVSGRVVDQETGEPVAGVLVRVGERAVVTDGRGRWAVGGLAPGAYAAEIDPVSVGVDRVVVSPDALRVDVAGGRGSSVETGVSRAARIDGRILLEPGGAGVVGAVIELRRGNERRRRITDANGRFVFAGLVPGEWTVAVASAELPPDFALERERITLTLAPGEHGNAELRVVRRTRPLIIVAGGDVVLGGPPARATPAESPRPQPLPPPPIRPTPAAVVPRPDDAPLSEAAAAAAWNPPADRPELLASARPWHERGASGFADWPCDTYVVQEGDESLTAIAWLVYRDGSLWPKIWLANRTVLPTPDRIVPGLELVIPPPGPLSAQERAAARVWTAARRPQR